MTADDRLDEIQARADAATIGDIPGYEVRSDGTVWSTRNWRGYGERQVAPVVGQGGYLKVRLSLPGGRRINRNVHRLVAESFLGPRPDGAHIRHLNGDQTDNRVSNLAWGTHAENMRDRDAHGTTARGSANGSSRLTEQDVLAIRTLAAGGLSQRSIAARFDVSQTAIWRILNEKGWTHV